ncbi:hypothetical protein QJS83_10360 [Bdellovibrio sp. 22V]|uniref:hypothetical protein n=1 Tax=Bdellovibrio TaxID=958 RepID=UPI002543D723|nr:hypothetical protein [Bdellovibrio sp. 22V]WII70862.1 hypothetical protein QJS83_10360 [Bdellovibrio sp. 22V]
MNFKTLIMTAAVALTLAACAQKAHQHAGCNCGHSEAKAEAKCSGTECAVDKKCAECTQAAAK